jgi:hypothetical protein
MSRRALRWGTVDHRVPPDLRFPHSGRSARPGGRLGAKLNVPVTSPTSDGTTGHHRSGRLLLVPTSAVPCRRAREHPEAAVAGPGHPAPTRSTAAIRAPGRYDHRSARASTATRPRPSLPAAEPAMAVSRPARVQHRSRPIGYTRSLPRPPPGAVNGPRSRRFRGRRPPPEAAPAKGTRRHGRHRTPRDRHLQAVDRPDQPMTTLDATAVTRRPWLRRVAGLGIDRLGRVL